jgi:capsular polysaccharide biosynthesis protein
MASLECRIVRNGIFVPAGVLSKFSLVYDDNLCLVEESALRRGEDGAEDISLAPSRLPGHLIPTGSAIDEKLVFLGWYDVAHYGHWLTEGLARYWYLLAENQRGLKIPVTWNLRSILKWTRDRVFRSKSVHWPIAVSAFDLRAQDFIRVSKPSRFAVIHVPKCSMVNRCEIHQPHIDVTRKIASHVTNPKSLVHDTRPVYLSRMRLKKGVRSYLNEEPIESYCRNRGYRIVYPEQLSLKEQIEMFNSNDVFVGLVGSAFHSIMFRYVDRPAKCIYLGDGRTHTNCDIIDSLMGNESSYVNCCTSDEGPQRNLLCDPEKAIAALSRI